MIKWIMSYPKILKKIKKFWLEIILISIALVVTISSIVLYLLSTAKGIDNINDNTSTAFETDTKLEKMYVDVSGAVNDPGLYEASNTDRLKNLIEKAGGLTPDADKDFFAINFNLANRVVDEQKIYIPTVWEVSNGYYIDNTTQTNKPLSNRNNDLSLETISVNEATLEELDTLPGVGKITAQKIIDNRPYGALQELIDRKILGKTVYENIKILIGI